MSGRRLRGRTLMSYREAKNSLRLVSSHKDLVEELNALDSFCLYVGEAEKGRIGAWYLPVSRYMRMTIEEAEETLRFLRWLRDVKPGETAIRAPAREPWHKLRERTR